MQCPYCHAEMALGCLYGRSDGPVYWLPDGRNWEDLLTPLFSEQRLRDAGGFPVDKPSRHFIRFVEKPDSYHCPNCHILITRLFDQS